MSDLDSEKRLAAARAIEYVQDGMIVGLGSGSTSAHATRLLGERVRGGLRIRGVPTSEATASLAREVGIPLATLDEVGRIDVAIDGADQIDPALNLIKGGGGALLREKVVAFAAARFVVIADSSKMADVLGSFPLPLEVVPFASRVVSERVTSLGGTARLRKRADGEVYLTDQGNQILDCSFGAIAEPGALQDELERIPGVAEHGLFINYADEVIVARGTEIEARRHAGAKRGG